MPIPEGIKRYTETCVQGGSPPCVCACPLNMDIKKFVAKIKAGNFNSAYRDYRNRVVFPAVLSRVCEAPCRAQCPVELSMLLLERASVEYAKSRAPERYSLPPRAGRIAVVGGGLSGLACAQRLAAKKYVVTVFERGARIGGSLAETLPAEYYLEEFELQFSGAPYTLEAGREIRGLDELFAEDVFDCVYISTGSGGETFGLLPGRDSETRATARQGVFLGGRILGGGHAEALADGLAAATSIEAWLKIGSSSIAGLTGNSACLVKPYESAPDTRPLIPASGEAYTRDEALEEAGHCLLCDCTVCYDACEYMKSQGLMPKELEVKALSGREATNQRFANRLIATCALCGHCAAICDFDASVERTMCRAKQKLFEDGGFAPIYHDFYMRDLADAVGDAYLCRPAPRAENAQASHLFFPGCQAAKTNPEYVLAPYRYMLEKAQDTALMLACCGVPALYAGDRKTMRSVHERLASDIHALGDPVCVLACPTCAKTFDEFLPGVKTISLWEFVVSHGLPAMAKKHNEAMAIFDPCASRKFPDTQDAVRVLSEALTGGVAELPQNRALALCCGQGGHIYAANPMLSRKFAARAVAQSDLPFLTYCTNCRDLFLSAGKQTLYLSDLVFGIEPLGIAVHILQKERNRGRARSFALKEFWNEDAANADADGSGKDDGVGGLGFLFPEPLLEKADALLVSAAEVQEVILSAEAERDFLVNEGGKTRIASKQIGLLTLWAEYRMSGKAIDVVNVYAHRIEFTPELPCKEVAKYGTVKE